MERPEAADEAPSPVRATGPIEPAGDATPDRRLTMLARAQPFRDVDRAALERLSAVLQLREVPAGEMVCRIGEQADAYYLIDAGQLSVIWENDETSRVLRRLGPGDGFGEIALLRGGVRTASVRADTDARLWALSTYAFATIRADSPALAAASDRLAREWEDESRRLVSEVEQSSLASLSADGGVLRIGRRADNDLVLSSPLVSGHHAELERRGDSFRLRDLHSSSGTFVNGAEVAGTVALRDGDEIWLGDERLIFDRAALRHCIEPDGLRISAAGVCVDAPDGRRLLNDVSLSILPGELVAIVAADCAESATLLATLAGARPPSSGRIDYNGSDYDRSTLRFRRAFGVVPRHDTLHGRLALRQALGFAARLRLPADAPDAERRAAVEHVLDQVALGPLADRRIDTLNAGQRKRAAIAAELFGGARALFLDDPTADLDPAGERELLALLRRLTDAGSTVILSTSSARSIAPCDKVVVLATGGRLAFVGAPAEALRYFAIDTFDEIYARLAEQEPERWAQRFAASPAFAAMMAEQLPATAEPIARGRMPLAARGRRFLHRLRTLTGRNLALLAADRPALPAFVALAVALPLLLLAVFPAQPFSPSSADPRAALAVVFVLAAGALLYGAGLALHDDLTDDPYFVYRRDDEATSLPLVLGKALALAPLCVLSTSLAVLILGLGQRLPARGVDGYAPLLLLLWFAAFAALALGLLIVGLTSGPRRAWAVALPLLAAQIFLSGAAIAIPSLEPPARWLSRLSIVRWAFEASGNALGLNGLLHNGSSPIAAALLREYGDSFRASVPLAICVLAIATIVLLTAAALALDRRRRLSARDPRRGG